jgi:hypothetical protein
VDKRTKSAKAIHLRWDLGVCENGDERGRGFVVKSL